MIRLLLPGLLALCLAGGAPAQDTASVSVHDSGAALGPAAHECAHGHQVQRQTITLDTGVRRYSFAYSGCQDPSHGDLHPSSEGNFGMPEPWVGNWYWSGFIGVLINGTDAIKHKLTEMRVLESGARGSFQAVWSHPDAVVGLRILALPDLNHVLCDLSWKPKTPGAVKTVSVQLRCYPSFFTAANHRQGERHCQTPTADLKEPETLRLVPGQDTYLYYYDTVFDTAKGEGNGPCAAVLDQAALAGGQVVIGGYSEDTTLDLKPEAGHLRLALYDLSGSTNAQAEAYLKASVATDLARLQQTDFRPALVREFDPERFRAEATKLLADAAEDGTPLAPRVEGLLTTVGGLKARADAGDWGAEADMAQALRDSEEMLWRLRCYAVLNNPR